MMLYTKARTCAPRSIGLDRGAVTLAGNDPSRHLAFPPDVTDEPAQSAGRCFHEGDRVHRFSARRNYPLVCEQHHLSVERTLSSPGPRISAAPFLTSKFT
jgi:hypothetical protein